MMIDGQRVQTALDCLLENAVKFTTEGDAIVLRGYHESDQIVIEVSDEGVGIPPADLPHIFERSAPAPTAASTPAPASASRSCG
jgi:signal transduction histidine kinase